MKLVIAEKPSVALSYAKALNVTARKGGYFEGNGYIISWCIGHLVELANADVYDERYKKWDLSYLPIIPHEWRYIVSADKNNQFEVVQSLMNDKRITSVICGTDAGREGELIFRLVYNKAGCKIPIKRLWISSMEESAIIDGFNNLKDGAEYENLYHSALCRSKADWIVGINATRLFTKLYNKKLFIGRVQTPTLAMLYERNNAITGFVKEKYYNVKLNDLAVSERHNSQTEVEQIKTSCDGQKAVVSSVNRERKAINPPKLYDLTTLQREANRVHGFTAQQTLDYIQSLYEMKLVTYPRTDSQFLTEDMAGTVSSIIGILCDNIPSFKGIHLEANVAAVVNNGKVTDHHAIIPTAEFAKVKLDNIPDGERKVLLLIAGRLLCATAAKHEYESITAIIECGGYSFAAKGKSIVNDGWKVIERLIKGKDEDEETPLNLTEGQELDPAVCNITENYTQPPKQFTEDTLLSFMERAGNDEVVEDVERSGLGTPATRAAIIEKLIKSGFVKRDKKNLVVTAEGADLISLMPDVIKSAKLTAEWENTLALIARGEYSAEKFMTHIENLVKGIISSARENINPDKVAAAFTGGEVIGKCPRCGGNVCETPKTYTCSCGFCIWKNNKFFLTSRVEFTKSYAKTLLKNGKIEVKGLYSPKKNKVYNAFICLEDTGKHVNFKLEFPKERGNNK